MNAPTLKPWWKNRLPPPGEIVPVYALVAFALYGWTLFHFVWKVPSWLYFLGVGEVLILLARAIFTNLLESVAFTALILGLCIFLPAKFLRNRFVLRGGALAVALLAWIAYFDIIASLIVPPVSILIGWTALVLVTVPMLVYLAGRFSVVERFLLWLGDRLIVFLYLTIPLGLLSGGIIFFRFVFGGGE
ncbi:MAG: hypothetical protein AB1750_03060 [Chloroflexota bacterium]